MAFYIARCNYNSVMLELQGLKPNKNSVIVTQDSTNLRECHTIGINESFVGKKRLRLLHVETF